MEDSHTYTHISFFVVLLVEGSYVSKEELSGDGKEMVVRNVLLPILDNFPGLARLVCETVAELAKKGTCLSHFFRLTF